MELHPLSYAESPGQAVGGEIPLAGYTRDKLHILIGRDEKPVQNPAIVMAPWFPPKESAVKLLAAQIPHHNGQLARVDLALWWRGGGLRYRSGLGGIARNRSCGRIRSRRCGWLRRGRRGTAAGQRQYQG